jgi:hypothetical protein
MIRAGIHHDPGGTIDIALYNLGGPMLYLLLSTSLRGPLARGLHDIMAIPELAHV